MRAAVTRAPDRIEVAEIAEIERGGDEILVDVAAVGLCGSDVHFFLGTDPYASFPRVQGHEFSGVVVEGPTDAAPGDPAVGDLVAIEPLLPCGTCYACRRGRRNACMNLKVLGVHVDGALAERIAVRRGVTYVANGLTPELAALVEPLSIGVHATERARVSKGDRVVVFGAGPIGQAVTVAASQRGARVLAIDRVATRVRLALELGAERVVDSSVENSLEAVSEWTAGDGGDVVVEATGAPPVLRQCVAAAAHGARVVVLGTPKDESLFPVLEITRKELDILGSRNSVGCFPEAIRIARAMPERLEKLITHRFGLSETEHALRFAAEHPEKTEKIMIMVR